MKSRLVAILLLMSQFGWGQYDTSRLPEIKLTKGASLTLGGIVFTVSPMVAEITRYGSLFKANPGLTPNKVAFGFGIGITTVGLVTMISESKGGKRYKR